MKKIFTIFLALLAGLLLASCEMQYSEEYPELIQYYCCWGDSDWNDHSDPSLTLMSYNSSTGLYEIEINTTKKNQRFEITKGAGYSIEYMADCKGVCSADDDTLANFPKVKDNGFGSMQTCMPKANTTYKVTFNAQTEKYNLSEK